MSLVLTEEQESVRRTARELVRARAPIGAMRRLRDERDLTAFSRELWAEMGELGLAGTTLPESEGGNGLGFQELSLVLEECGRTLCATPLLSSVVLAGGAIARAGNAEQRSRHLPGVAAGTSVLAFAHDEGRRHGRDTSATLSVAKGELRLSGDKRFVLDAGAASSLVVTARLAGSTGREGWSLLIVPADAPGVHVERRAVVDSRNVADVHFRDVALASEHCLGTPGTAADVVEQTLDRATIALAAEMLGGAREAFERTLAYLKERKQFGVPIGSFQALKHRAAAVFCELELLTSIVREASTAADAGGSGDPADLGKLAAAAKARANDTFLLAVNEGVQMHGGIGVTDEHDIGLFLKRARVCEMLFGDSAFQRDRYARLSGY